MNDWRLLLISSLKTMAFSKLASLTIYLDLVILGEIEFKYIV